MLFELAILSSTSFTASLIRAALRRAEAIRDAREIQPEKAIELTRAVTRWQPPIYINAGGANGIGVPVGGGTVEEEEEIYSHVRLQTQSEKNNTLYPYDNMEFSSFPLRRSPHSTLHTTSYYINTPDHLSSFLENNSIDRSAFPAILPLRVKEVSYATMPTPLFHWASNPAHPLSGIVGYTRAVVGNRAALNSLRRPYVAFVGAFALITTSIVIADWRPGHSYGQWAVAQRWRQRLGLD